MQRAGLALACLSANNENDAVEKGREGLCIRHGFNGRKVHDDEIVGMTKPRDQLVQRVSPVNVLE